MKGKVSFTLRKVSEEDSHSLALEVYKTWMKTWESGVI